MSDAPTPADPALGMPTEMLDELASVDWHAEHPDVHHLAASCPCESPAVIGAFAARLVTGQAQLSSTRDGTFATVVGRVGPDRPALVQLSVLGHVEEEPCQCGHGAPHTSLNLLIDGCDIRRHTALDDVDVLQLVGDALATYAATVGEPATEHDHDDDGDGHRD